MTTKDMAELDAEVAREFEGDPNDPKESEEAFTCVRQGGAALDGAAEDGARRGDD